MKEIIAGPATDTGEIELLCLIRSGITPRTYLNNLGVVTYIIPTPPDRLPDWAIDLISETDYNDLALGTLAFVLTKFRMDNSMTPAELANRAREVYSAAKLKFISDYIRMYHQYFGVAIDE